MQTIVKEEEKQNLVQQYKKEGIIFTKTNLQSELSHIRSKIIELFDCIAQKEGLSVKNDADIQHLYETRKELWVNAYDRIPHLIELKGIVNHPEIHKIYKLCGLRLPGIFSSGIRVDMPNDDGFRFKTHQDIHYNQYGSLNSITVWIPLQDTPREMGSLLYQAGSHLQGVLYHDTSNRHPTIDDFDNSVLISEDFALGDVLTMSQFLVHASGYNRMDRVRFVMLLRVYDLASPEFIDRNGPLMPEKREIHFSYDA